MEKNYKLSIDFIMIVGKYFINDNDFINLIKVNSKFNQLLLMYKFNPISNCDLFPNIETQHFYEYKDIFYRKRNMFKYIYWIKPYLLFDYFNLIDNSSCIIKNIYYYKFLYFSKKMNFNIKNIYFNKLFKRLKNLNSGYLIFNYNNNYFGFIINNNIKNYPKLFKQYYFFNNKIYNKDNYDLFISYRFKSNNRIYLRDENYNDIMIVYNNKITYKFNNQFDKFDSPKIELINNKNDLLLYLPNLFNVTEFCIIES